MLYVSDPLCFKESMLISLEALSGYGFLRGFIESIPSTNTKVSIETTKEIEDQVKSCIKEFKGTKTYFWLREDFKNILYDIEIQAMDKIS
ncbi:hypothetical protein [Neobacillus vireti]|uniref:hypothetical protein n=1 Tax=Neobacillus vireti TaxID=220686 RepID=UPI002FFE5E06